MHYDKFALRLNADVSIQDGATFPELFGITDERAEVLDQKIKMAKSILMIEKDLPKALAYFLDECKHPNESHYCFFRLGQTCDCSLMGQVKVLSGTIESKSGDMGDVLSAIFADILKGKNRD